MYKEHDNHFNLRPPKRLSEIKSKAISELLNTPQHKNKAEEEKSYFLLYLNYAVNHIQEIAKIHCNNERNVRAELTQLKNADAVIFRLANFLCLFRFNDVAKDFKDYKELTIILVEKIFALRNFFAHNDFEGNVDALLDNREFYVLLEGILLSEARSKVIADGFRADKLSKLKLMNRHQDKNALNFSSKKEYELTRKGIIFLTCLGLYRDEAMEFLQLFVDMRLPEKCPVGSDPEICSGNCSKAGDDAKCNVAKAKALRELFSYFSCRKGRDVLNAADLDYMCFADILTYLNKAPAVSFDYLALAKENAMLRELEAQSTEIAENREHKYRVHRRFKNRFLSFSAAYCEDFALLPAIKFKRLDISDSPGRKRYIFGVENDNRNRMDRHYVIHDDSIQFEFVPENHYGNIKIKSLRSSICEDEFKKLLLIGEKVGYNFVNNKLNAYFTAYHKMLETIVNTDDPNDIYMEDVMEELKIISGIQSEDALSDDPNQLKRWLPVNLIRFFTQDDSAPSHKDLFDAVQKKLLAMQNHAEDFMCRMKKLQQWRRTRNDENKPPHPPKCTYPDVMNPPFSSSISDFDMVHWVFKYLNLYLTPDTRFRQLSRGEQHNPDTRDHEYQMVHAAIGKYSLDQKGMNSLIKKIRPELQEACKTLEDAVIPYLKNEAKYLRNNPRYLNNGKPAQAQKTLFMLAFAAAKLYKQFCDNKIEEMEQVTDIYAISVAQLRTDCRQYGIKTGMPLDRNSLIKTILRLDEQQWQNAFDYENGKKRQQPRTLSDMEHIVSQIPIPKGFADQMMIEQRNKKFFGKFFRENGSFDFGCVFRTVLKCADNVTLRDYYDVSPMIAWSKERRMNSGLNPESDAIYTPSAIDKAIRDIKKTEYQDKLLLTFALAYRKRALENNNGISFKSGTPKGTSIYHYFETPIFYTDPKSKVAVKLRPNELTRPSFWVICKAENFRAARKRLDPDAVKNELVFYDLLSALREIQAIDRNKRLEISPWIAKFDNCVVLPKLEYSGDKKANRDMEFPFYQKQFRKLTREQFDIIADARNAVYHDGIDLDITEALELLKSLFPQKAVRRF